MSKLINKQSYVETVLASAVAHSGTFTVPYPTGTTQQSFIHGRAGTNNYIVVDGNNRFTTISLAYGASEITVTNSTNTTLAAGSKVLVGLDQADGDDTVVLAFPINLAAITGAGDVVTEIDPSIAGTLVHVFAVVKQPVTTAAKAASLNFEIGTTNVTGGVIALTSANCTPLGAVVHGSDITAANTLTRDSKLSLEAASVTAFAEGEVTVYAVIRRNLTADQY